MNKEKYLLDSIGKDNGGTLSMSWGKYGGFYFYRKYTIRLCLGWLCFTYFPFDIDNALINLLDATKQPKQ